MGVSVFSLRYRGLFTPCFRFKIVIYFDIEVIVSALVSDSFLRSDGPSCRGKYFDIAHANRAQGDGRECRSRGQLMFEAVGHL